MATSTEKTRAPPALPISPQRIVSLVPSDTYTLCRLGAADRLVGRTRYCVAPPSDVGGIEVVGGVRDVDIARVVTLAPELVVANQEDNTQADVEALMAAGVPVLVSFPRSVAEGLEHVQRLATLLPELGEKAVAALRAARERLAHFAARRAAPVRVFVPIWLEPLMTVGPATVVSDMVALAGGQNVFATPSSTDGPAGRYPSVTFAEVAARKPELVLLPDEPYSFTDGDAQRFAQLGLGEGASWRPLVRRCDGKDLCWYGLRCIEGLDRLSKLIDAGRVGLSTIR